MFALNTIIDAAEEKKQYSLINLNISWKQLKFFRFRTPLPIPNLLN